ncbi:MAG: hypothetical protein A3A61_02910 [Candidatus Woykebacteria bacterium RIFCSPLOWO2_01_FULL_43_14]|uniref:Uncharacterized protein n=1 Tax=Candidatus Woykebacteria bacterium RIFCSPLOWO2_01_FULL_43_14 TaxID=1802605 RepID=A0A1G1WU97_9BACT|nr:MAG: hypothetical protein A3A61_02910 [Candidatus Woykebacteria bacterium RIFCSPLOWO2_01_FULL_43_14]
MATVTPAGPGSEAVSVSEPEALTADTIVLVVVIITEILLASPAKSGLHLGRRLEVALPQSTGRTVQIVSNLLPLMATVTPTGTGLGTLVQELGALLAGIRALVVGDIQEPHQLSPAYQVLRLTQVAPQVPHQLVHVRPLRPGAITPAV